MANQATQDGNGSARRKKFVACGHRGFGQYCHRCALADSLEKQDIVKNLARIKSLRANPDAAPATLTASVPQ